VLSAGLKRKGKAQTKNEEVKSGGGTSQESKSLRKETTQWIRFGVVKFVYGIRTQT